MPTTITLAYPDDEHLEVRVNGKTVVTANHDNEGNAGIAAVERTVRAIADAAGFLVDELWEA